MVHAVVSMVQVMSVVHAIVCALMYRSLSGACCSVDGPSGECVACYSLFTDVL